MKSLFSVTLILFAISAECKGRLDEAALTKYVKALDVSRLDKTLAPQQFEKWLLSGPAHIEKLEYLPGNCDLKPTRQEPKGGWPLCVKVILRRRQLWGHAIITVGTVRRGIHGEPQLTRMSLDSTVSGQTIRVTKLSELPRLMAELEEADNKARK